MRTTTLLAALIAGLLGLSGCEKGGEGGGQASGAGASAKDSASKDTGKPAGDSSKSLAPAGGGSGGGSEIVIGHYGSLTGPQATFGQSTDNAIKLAVKEINAAGGVKIDGQARRVRLVSEDTEGKAEKAGTVVTKLITRDKVSAVLGEVASKVSMQGAPVCQQFGVPMITPSSTHPDVTKKGDMVFRVCFIDPFQGFAVAKFAKDDLKFTKVALLYDQAGTYSVGLKDEFAKAFKGLGGTIVSEQAYTEGASDFNAQLTRIRESNPEAIFVPGYYSDVAKIAIQARKLGMAMPLLGGDGWDSDELGNNAKEAIEGCFYSNHYAPDQPSEAVKEFVRKYEAEFHAVPDGLAALGYDAARILFDAMERGKATSGKPLRDAIARTKGFPGVTGTITLNDQRDAVKPVVIVERKGGKWIYRATIEPPK